jgi:hypothetical protein
MIRAESKFALMANHEMMNLNGSGLGNHYLFDENGNPAFVFTTFNRNRSHTHVSPLFEQTVNLELKPFEYIPFFNRMSLFDHATFRAGWTFLVVGQVVRPTDTIVYNAPPLNPGITVRRSHAFFNAWNIGVEWTR